MAVQEELLRESLPRSPLKAVQPQLLDERSVGFPDADGTIARTLLIFPIADVAELSDCAELLHKYLP